METIEIEIGDNLLKAIKEIAQNSLNGGVDMGPQIREAFGINFSEIIDNKFIELKK